MCVTAETLYTIPTCGQAVVVFDKFDDAGSLELALLVSVCVIKGLVGLY